tara:strand:- start:1929 stop:5282 length:3354 start_codon:yes stop_codon:yes gene_type:complete
MSRLVPNYIHVLIVADPAFCPAERTSAGLTATQSAPIPGLTVNNSLSSMEIEQAGESWQGETLTLSTVRTGSAGTPGANSARMAWHGEAGKSGTGVRGWLPFTVATDWHALSSAATLDTGTYPGIGTPTKPHGIRLLNGDVLIAFEHESGGTAYIGCVRYDAQVGGFDPSFGRYDSGGAAYVWSAQDAYSWVQDAVSEDVTASGLPPTCPCLMQLPSGRVLMLFSNIVAYAGGNEFYAIGMAYSDDNGSTWTFETSDTGARIPLATGVPYSIQCVWHNGFMTLVVAHDNGGGSSSFYHWYSSDEGGSWTFVESDPTTDVEWSPQLIACDDGSVLALWIAITGAATEGALKASRALTPSQAFGGSEFTISPNAAATTEFAPGQDHLAACLGNDHTIHLMAVVADDSTYAERLRYLRFSQDVAGVSGVILIPYPENQAEVEPIDFGGGTGSSATPYARCVIPWGERLMCLYDYDGGTVQTAFQLFGGFSSIDWNGQGWGLYNYGVVTERYGVWWDATYLPSDLTAAWTPVGPGAEGSSVEKALSYDFTGGANYRYNSYTAVNGTGGSCVVWARLRADSGGSLSANNTAITLRCANAVYDYDVKIRFSTTAIRVIDNNNAGATLGTDVTGLTASQTIDVMVSLVGSRLALWYKEASSQVWIAGQNANATNDGATPNIDNLVTWGAIANSTQKSTWFFVGTSTFDAPPWPVTVVEPNSSTRVQFGSEVSVWPQYLADGRTYQAVSSPARAAENWTLSAGSPYPIDNLDPIKNSSPGQMWRSLSDTVEQVIPWNPGAADQPMSSALGLYIRNTNFLTLEWEYKIGGGAWTAIASVSMVLLSGSFSRSGYMVTPSGSAGSVSVATDELAGSWVVLTNTAKNYYAKIAHNTAGTWSNATDALPITIRLEGDLTGLPTTGTIQIIAPETACVVNTGALGADQYRVRIPVRTHELADQDYHTASVLLIGPAIGLGQPPAWGSTFGAERVQAVTTAPNRRRKVKVLQTRNLRSCEVPFTDPILARDIYNDPSTQGPPDTVALASTGAVLTFSQDPRQIESVLMAAQGAKYPVVYLPAMVPPGGTIRARDLILYSLIMSNSSTRTKIIGQEGVQNLQTISSLRLEEVG